MSREEAIEVVKAYREKLTNSASNQLDGDIEAFDMAIKALSQESTDAISREMALKECHDIIVDGERYRVIQEETLLALPPVTQKPIECSEHYIDGVHAIGYREGYKDAQKQKSGKWIVDRAVRR